MPTGKNWVNFFYINIAFAIYIAGIFYYNQIAQIRLNWPLYRCNPMYMFLADNVEQNFVYCIQSMQTNFIGYLLQPLTFITDFIGSIIGGFLNDIQFIRAMFNKVRTFFSTIFESIFGVFMNIIIEFQIITIGIIDLIGKTIGIITTLMYMLDGSIKTMQSTWSGPPGQIVRAVGKLGKCFHPYTSIKLKDGTVKYIKDIDLGDILEDGSVVESVMKINNKKEKLPLYEIKGSGINYTNIYVTGSHLVYDETSKKFIQIKDYSKATISQNVQTDWFSCLITDTHHIPIGKELFWDWEDHFIKISKQIL